jgi:hypothetical protein
MFSKLISKLLQLIIDDNRLSNILTSKPGPTHINCYMQRGFGWARRGYGHPLKCFLSCAIRAWGGTNREHLLEEILLISIAAVLSGAESWNDIAEYGEDKLEWLKTFLTLPSGIPSHDTFNRVFAALDPEEMEKGFVAWVSSIARLTAGEMVAIDGKALCGTRETGKKTLVHMVSAWAESNGLLLAQRKVDETSNEITAIPKLLDALELPER